MALEALIKAVDNSVPTSDNPDLVWKAGDVVTIKQLPHSGWGNKENLANGFYIIRVTDVNYTDEQIQTLLDWVEDQDGNVTKRREYAFEVSNLTQPQQDELTSTGYLELTKLQVMQVLRSR